MDVLSLFEILGTISFAASGSLTAIHKRMDPFGIFIIALVTSLGGGTLRDVLLGTTPVGWMHNLNFFYTVLITTILSVIFRHKIAYLRKSLFLFDTIGLGIFTIAGVEIALQSNLDPTICIVIGTLSGSFGGVTRDILCNEIPIIFRQEIYATACIIGGLVYVGLNELTLSHMLVYSITISIIILVRLVAVKYKLTMPTFYQDEDSDKLD